MKKPLQAVGRSLRLRTGDAKTAVLRQTARVLRLTRQVSRQTQRVLRNSRYLGRHLPAHAAPLVQHTRLRLRRQLQLTTRVMAQSHTRIRGTTSIPDRVVSVFDSEARPIRRGKLSTAGCGRRRPSPVVAW